MNRDVRIGDRSLLEVFIYAAAATDEASFELDGDARAAFDLLLILAFGGGVVADSNGPYEHTEASNKARAVLNAIAAAETLTAPDATRDG